MKDQNTNIVLSQEVEDLRQNFIEQLRLLTLEAMHQVLEEERTAFCGPIHHPTPDSPCVRAGTTHSRAVLQGKRVEIQRPRVRKIDPQRGESREGRASPLRRAAGNGESGETGRKKIDRRTRRKLCIYTTDTSLVLTGNGTSPLILLEESRIAAGWCFDYHGPLMFWEEALNAPQREAVKQVNGPVLILAGAGTGKTRTLTCRVAHMLRRGIVGDSVLCLTFSNKAANEMRERVHEMIGSARKKSARPVLSTFHAFGVKILRESIHHLGYGKQFVIYDQSDQIGLMKRLIAQFSGEELPKDPGVLLAMVSKYRNWQAAPIGEPPKGWGPDLDRVARRYVQNLKTANAVDFDDLLLLTLELFRGYPEAVEKYRSQYQYVMVDEYQDTNRIQLEILLLLAKKHQNLCVVGDDDQSIYGWRGAEISNLLNLEDHFPSLKIIKLEQNYRSTNTILKAANALIRNNSARREKNLWSENGIGELIGVHSYDTDEIEAKSVVDRIDADRILRGINYGSQAILFRTNQQSRVFEIELRKARIPYVLIGGMSFFDRKEIRDTLAYLKLLVNPSDDTSLLRILNTPPRGIGLSSVQKILAAAEDRSSPIWKIVPHTDVQELLQPKARESLMNFYSQISVVQEKLQDSQGTPGDILTELFKEIGFFDEVRKIEKDEESGEGREKNVRDLIDSIDSLVAGNNKSHAERILDFLTDTTLDADKQNEKKRNSDGNVVTMITMHSCKGLEFPVVYIAGCEYGIIPHMRSLEEGTVEEERRLFYVACTRAQKLLSLGYCRGRMARGKLMARNPSPFLTEIPEELLDRRDSNTPRPVSKSDSSKFFSSMREMIGGDDAISR